MCEQIFQHRPWSLQDIIIPISDDAESFPSQIGVPLLVALRFGMLAAVDLDDKPVLETNEIQNVVSKRDLSSKFQLCQAPVAQQKPHLKFGVGEIMAQMTRPATS